MPYFFGAPFTTGKFSWSQLCNPPRKETTFVKPSAVSALTAPADASPLSQ